MCVGPTPHAISSWSVVTDRRVFECAQYRFDVDASAACIRRRRAPWWRPLRSNVRDQGSVQARAPPLVAGSYLFTEGNSKGKGTYTWYSASSWIIKRSGMVHVLKESHSFISTPTRSIRNRYELYSCLCLCLSSYSWYSFTDAGGMEGCVGLDGWTDHALNQQITRRHSCHKKFWPGRWRGRPCKIFL